jgi:hypothetical protein
VARVNAVRGGHLAAPRRDRRLCSSSSPSLSTGTFLHHEGHEEQEGMGINLKISSNPHSTLNQEPSRGARSLAGAAHSLWRMARIQPV